MAATVGDILKEKGHTVYTTDPDATVYEAIERMVELNVGALLVAAAGTACGIFTERDYLRRIALKGRTSRTTTVKEVMTPTMVSVVRSTTLDECMAIMTERRVRHLPVIEEGDLLGVVSIGDIVKNKLREQHAQIQELTEYIQGSAVGVFVG